jgi:hypothetical protein
MHSHHYPARAAMLVRDHLLEDPTPATDLFAQQSGQWVTMHARKPAHYWLTQANQRLLRCLPRHAWSRSGALVLTDGTIAAHTQLILLPDQLPDGALEQIEAGASCGTVLAPYGMTRQDRAAALTGRDPAVISSAVLMLEKACGLAYEHVTEAYCRLITPAAQRPRSRRSRARSI